MCTSPMTSGDGEWHRGLVSQYIEEIYVTEKINIYIYKYMSKL